MNPSTIFLQNTEMSAVQWQNGHYNPNDQLSSQPNQMSDYNAPIEQIFPNELPCEKPDPFNLRNNPILQEYTYKNKRSKFTIKLSNDQYNKIETRRIKMLNHIAQCNNPQCESVYVAHIDDRLCFRDKEVNNRLPTGSIQQPMAPPIRIGYKRGLHCKPLMSQYYILCIFPQILILLCLGHCNNKYDNSQCYEGIILNNESIDLQIDADPNYLYHHRCCCKYTGQKK